RHVFFWSGAVGTVGPFNALFSCKTSRVERAIVAIGYSPSGSNGNAKRRFFTDWPTEYGKAGPCLCVHGSCEETDSIRSNASTPRRLDARSIKLDDHQLFENSKGRDIESYDFLSKNTH
ncbi:hypothetical protein F441_07119, partial [Phytophthora nicotianae CJ01A1]